jgi:hypothetical protein
MSTSSRSQLFFIKAYKNFARPTTTLFLPAGEKIGVTKAAQQP